MAETDINNIGQFKIKVYEFTLKVSEIRNELNIYLKRYSGLFKNIHNNSENYNALQNMLHLLDQVIGELESCKNLSTQIYLTKEILGSSYPVHLDWPLNLKDINDFNANFAQNIKNINLNNILPNTIASIKNSINKIRTNILVMIKQNNKSTREELQQLETQIKIRGKLKPKEISDIKIEILELQDKKAIALEELKLKYDKEKSANENSKIIQLEKIGADTEIRLRELDIEKQKGGADTEIRLRELDIEKQKVDVEFEKIVVEKLKIEFEKHRLDAEVRIAEIAAGNKNQTC